MKFSRITAASLAFAATLVACSGDSSKTDSTALKNDSALAASMAMANKDTGKITLSDTANSAKTQAPPTVTKASTTPKATAPKPKTTAPAPQPKTQAPAAAPAPTTGTVAAGTVLTLSSAGEVCTNTNKIGDDITATTTEATSGTNGVSIPAGAVVNMTVTNLKRSENVNDKVIMEFKVNSIVFGGKTHNVEASVTGAEVDKIRDQPAAKDVQKVAVGAAAGAVAGRLLGKSGKATAVGAAAGAAAGAGAAVATANYQGCIHQGKAITVRLDAPLSLSTGL
jgi:hypothetical protein